VGALHPLNTYTFAHMPAGQTASITWSGKGYMASRFQRAITISQSPPSIEHPISAT
jgi:hypothetical protein